MNHRLSHAMQQEQLDDALSAFPGKRWGWLLAPDPRWLAAVNTTTLREVNAVRMFVLVTVVWNLLAVAVVAYALGRCHLTPGLLASGETAATVRRLCEESVATARLFDFASGVLQAYGLLLAAMATVAVGGMFVKRATDTEHVERKERAKKAPVFMAPVTGEHPAQAPVQQTVNVGDDAITASNGERRQPKGGDGPGDDERVD